jgi:hypothetical protein
MMQTGDVLLCGTGKTGFRFQGSEIGRVVSSQFAVLGFLLSGLDGAGIAFGGPFGGRGNRREIASGEHVGEE